MPPHPFRYSRLLSATVSGLDRSVLQSTLERLERSIVVGLSRESGGILRPARWHEEDYETYTLVVAYWCPSSETADDTGVSLQRDIREALSNTGCENLRIEREFSCSEDPMSPPDYMAKGRETVVLSFSGTIKPE